MESILYLFSQFTPEALLFEAWILCILLASYAAFYIFRKRRYGLAEGTIPTGLVKIYLSQLITDAQLMREQLFGIIRSSGVRMTDAELKATLEAANEEGLEALLAHLRGPTAPSMPLESRTETPSADPAIREQLVEVEGKLRQQAEAIDKLHADKARLEADLEQARTALAAAGPAARAPAAGGDEELRMKLRSLEERLEEYSVIEDDLANLKRLQQENAQLKAALQGAGAPSVAPAVAEAEAGVPIEEAAGGLGSSEALPVDSPAVEGLLGQSTADAAPSGGAPISKDPPQVAPVTGTPTPAAAAPGNTAPAASASTEAGKSEADLVAEFEKMLQ